MNLHRKLFVIALLIVAGTLFTTPARADFIIDFSGIAGGTVSYAGGANPLVGTNIVINAVAGIGTPLNPTPPAPPLVCAACLLNFNTGPASNTGGYNWTGTAGNFFTIVGTIPSIGIVVPTALLTGAFGSAALTAANTIAIALGTDTKNERLLAYFGLGNYPGSFSGSVHLNPAPAGGAFTAAAFSTDVQNNVVPEPGSLLLLGTGLLGVGAMVVRRRKKE